MRLILFPNTREQQLVELRESAATIGRAEDNLIILAGREIADYHARIFQSEGCWYITDISGRGDIMVDGEQVERAELVVGSRLNIGGAVILVTALEAGTALVQAASGQMQISEQQGSPQNYGMPVQYEMGSSATVSSVLPRMALIFSLCGPFLLGMGWLLGGIFGVISLSRSVTRQSGRRIAWWAVVISIFWIIVMSAGLTFFSWSHLRDIRIARNEGKVEALMKAITVTEYFVKYAELYDADRDEVSEYVGFDKLQESNYHAMNDNLAESPLQNGYYFKMKRADESGFVCVAVPVEYGITGRKSYWIDDQGRIYALDIKGAEFKSNPINVSEKDQTPTIIETVGNELAGDIARVAEKAFKTEEYGRCKRIIENIRKLFPHSPAATDLATLDNNTTPFLIEFKSRELFERAEALIQANQLDAAIQTMRMLISQYPSSSLAGSTTIKIAELTENRAWQELERAETYLEQKQLDLALGTLQGISQKYPEAANIGKLKDRIATCETAIMKLMEAESAELLVKAHKLESENEYEEAYTIYLTIKNRYGKTRAAEGIDEVLKKNRKMIEELEANTRIDEVLKLKRETEMPRILSLIELLERGYAHTEAYVKNQQVITRLKHECQAYKYISDAREKLKEESHRAALASLELAIKEDPSVEVTMKEELEQCFLTLGDAAFENQDYKQALEYYNRYIQLEPRYSQLNVKKLMECQFQLARMEFQNEKYPEAEKHLLSCSERYNTNPEYNFLFGRVLMNLGKWEGAVTRLANSVAPDTSFAREARLYWALAQYRYALNEGEVLRQLVMEDDEFGRIIKSYNIAFDVVGRTNAIQKLNVATISATQNKTFAELTTALCALLDDLAVDSERLVQLDKDNTDQKLAQRTKIRSRIQDLPNQLHVIRAAQSADVYRKVKITEQLAKVHKLFQTLNQALAGISSTKKTPEMSKIITQISDKVSLLRAAQETLTLYTGLEDQRQRTVISIVENFVDRLSVNSANASVLKKNADDLRDLYTSIKETELAVSALRNIASAYAIAPPMTSMILSEPTAAETAKKVIQHEAEKK